MIGNIITVAIIGGECTGKTTLTQALAVEFQTAYSLEYTRIFVTQFGRLPQFDDIAWIVKNQLFLQKKATQQIMQQTINYIDYKLDHVIEPVLKPVFFDTDLLVNWVLAEHYLGKASFTPDCVDLLIQNTPDVYIVLNPVIAWQADEHQRESDAVRHIIHEKIRLKLNDLNDLNALQHTKVYFVSELCLEQRIVKIKNILKNYS